MAEKVKRTKTKYTGVYFNENTKKYDVKYNYKVYNPSTQKNDYKSKWGYNFTTLTEARAELAKLQANGIKAENKDITLNGAFELWKIKMQVDNGSPVSVSNTEQQLKMISQFIPLETKIKDITEDVYLRFCADIRNHGYSEETLYSLNATFRKLINLTYKKRLVKENVLDYADNMRTKKKNSEDYRLIEKEEFDLFDSYFKNNKFIRLGQNNYPKYRLLINILYYCGLRIGEALALTYNDFEEFDYYKKNDEKPVRIVPTEEDTKGEHLRGMRVKVTKAYVSAIKITKSPKNFKKRAVPLPPAVQRLYMRTKESHKQIGGDMNDRIFPWGQGATNTMLHNVCTRINIPSCSSHSFRHTYISNLIKNAVPLPVIEKVSGDTQTTILRTYSHMFESDEVMVLIAMENL